MSSFEFIDRRRMGKEEPPVEVGPKPIEAPASGKSEWRNLVYILAVTPQQDGSIIISGRAVGVRKDGVGPFVADYILPAQWGPDFMWQPYAKKRIDTYLTCPCVTGDQCKYHRMSIEHWRYEDIQRIQAGNGLPVPEAIELLMKAQAAAKPQSNLIIPR